MIATSADVARLAGVSRATVSQILNGRGERFADATHERVKQAAKELDYQPSAAGRTLARGSSDFVIALIPNTTFGSNLQDLFQTMTDALAEIGLTLVLRLTTPATESLDRIVSGMKPRALVSITPLSDDQRALLESRGVSVVEPTTAAGRDQNREIGAMQAEYLIARGHTRLAFAHLDDHRQDPFGAAREEGVRDVCRAHGLAEPAIVRLDIDPDDALAALAELDAPGIAIACYNDDVATALLSAIAARGLRVPEDIALIGMDHTPLSRVTVPPLTTMSYDLEAAARSVLAGVLASLGTSGASVSESIAAESLRLIPGGSA